jgi:hypothetical protein
MFEIILLIKQVSRLLNEAICNGDGIGSNPLPQCLFVAKRVCPRRPLFDNAVKLVSWLRLW